MACPQPRSTPWLRSGSGASRVLVDQHSVGNISQYQSGRASTWCCRRRRLRARGRAARPVASSCRASCTAAGTLHDTGPRGRRRSCLPSTAASWFGGDRGRPRSRGGLAAAARLTGPPGARCDRPAVAACRGAGRDVCVSFWQRSGAGNRAAPCRWKVLADRRRSAFQHRPRGTPRSPSHPCRSPSPARRISPDRGLNFDQMASKLVR